jgi:transaldolase
VRHLDAVGIDLDDVGLTLEDEGVGAFERSFRSVLDELATRASRFAHR